MKKEPPEQTFAAIVTQSDTIAKRELLIVLDLKVDDAAKLIEFCHTFCHTIIKKGATDICNAFFCGE